MSSNTLLSPEIQNPDRVAPHRIPEFAERVAGAFLFAVVSPVIAASAVVIFLFSRQSPCVAHLRVGKGGKLFWVWKLRTMWERKGKREKWQLAEYIIAEPSNDEKDPSDPRVGNRFAAFCRRHSIDELPQLWHVLSGEMSLVGPRPLTRSEVARYYRGHADELLSVKPGITGLWQVQGRSAIKFPERAALDLELVRNLTAKRYLSILLRTFPVLFHGKGAW